MNQLNIYISTIWEVNIKVNKMTLKYKKKEIINFENKF